MLLRKRYYYHLLFDKEWIMLKHKKVFGMLAMSMLLVVGCSSNEDAEKEPKEDGSPIVEDQQEDEIVYHTPLTGEAVAEEVTQRPVIVTINNHPDARPQSGLASADIIYEMVAEGNVTRFLAVFQSELPKNIGPVRSARDYFIELAQGYDAFYIAHGYSPDAKSLLSSGEIDNINGMQYDGTLFKRSTDRVAPHNSYITGENVLKGAEKVGASMIYEKKVAQTFYEDEESVKIGLDAKSIDVEYGNSESFHNSYIYNGESNSYERMSGGIATVDALTDEPITLSNVLFFEMPHRTIDNKGRQSITMTGGGKAYVCQNGYLREVQWENNDGLPVAVEDDGSEVKLVPGNTWVHFVSTSPGIATSVTYQPE